MLLRLIPNGKGVLEVLHPCKTGGKKGRIKIGRRNGDLHISCVECKDEATGDERDIRVEVIDSLKASEVAIS